MSTSAGPTPARPLHIQALTLLVEMRCNSYCIFCGSRAVDPKVRRIRKELGLRTPLKVAIPSLDDLVRRGADGTRHLALRVLGRDPDPMDAPRSPHGGFLLPGAMREIERARRNGFQMLRLQGGEPTIWPWLSELVQHAREIGFEDVIVVTNGRVLADERACTRLLASGLTGIVFSLLGPNAATHDALAASPGSFAAVVAAIRNTAAYARQNPGRLHVSANVIVSAPSVDSLAEEVQLLADLGVEAATLHLVRFALFANEPRVREQLKFPLARARPALASALDVAASTGIDVHAADIPLCQHPWLRGAEVESVLARARSYTRHARKPYLHYDSVRLLPRRSYAKCKRCVLAHACRQAPREYLEDGGAALEPITAAFLGASLASLAPGDGPSARRRLEDVAAAVVALHAASLVTDVELAPLAARIREGFAAHVRHAVERGDSVSAQTSLYGLLGLRPPLELRADQRLLERARAMAADAETALPNGVERYAARDAAGVRWIDFAPGLSVSLAGGGENGTGAVALRDVAPAPPADVVPGGSLVYALFVLDVFQRLRRASALRWSSTNVELADERGWHVAWTRVAPWAVRLRDAR